MHSSEKMLGLWLGAAILAATGCGNAPAPEAQAPALRFEDKRFEKQTADCSGDKAPCAKVDFRYVEASDPANAKAADRMNAAIQKFLNASLREGATPSSLDAIFQALAADYEALRKRDAAYRHPWKVERWAELQHQGPDLITVRLTERLDTGGAHPNETVKFLNFARSSGENVELGDLMVPGYQDRLRALGELRFREVKKLEASTDLKQAGFQFSGNEFALTQNYGVTEKGLIFRFNAYEIAPYSAGPTELLLPFTDVGSLIKPNYRLSN